ncbi:MAG: hypothetical protein PHU51_03250 [Candidatus Nanoarchaeia archaeon]|nr:hypothetical protein [Candidatus Nanoarchaeia archaeon]
MKEFDWNDCLKNNSARIITEDIKRSQSLIQTSKDRLDLINEINEKNCNFVFEDCYTSLMELLQAITFMKGFNVGNHICLGFFLRDVLERNDLFEIFDDLRYKRNSLTYYGNKMEFEIAKDAIIKCKKIISELNKLVKSIL